MITREQVADLQPGDVVELCNGKYTIRGPLEDPGDGSLRLHIWHVREEDGEPYLGHINLRTLTVVSRAPRPLYVNHPRTEPVPGDVVRDGNGDVRFAMPPTTAARPEHYGDNEVRWWAKVSEYDGQWLHCSTDYMQEFGPLRLLVDGETGQVVPS